MASKAIQRTLLMVALIATAHLVKPFSFRTVATHLLHSATSFSFILPDSTAGSLEQANYLATALDNGYRMMEARQQSGWMPQRSLLADEGILVSSLMPLQMQSAEVKAFKAVSPCRDMAKPVKKKLAKAKLKPRVVKNLLAMSVTEPVEKAVEKALTAAPVLAVSLPAFEIEQVIAVSLPTLKTKSPSISGVATGRPTPAASLIYAAPSKTCPMDEKKAQSPLTRAEQLRMSVQQLVQEASSVRAACAEERTRARKVITQIGAGPC